jgi:hypothetical protein
MGEIQNQPFQLSFDASLKVDFQGSRVTSDGGLILVRELDERLGLGELIEQHLMDSRRGKNTQFPFPDLLRQSVCSRLAGYEDVNDADRLSQDPTFRLISSVKVWDRGAAQTSRLQTFETGMLGEEEKFAGLAAINRELTAKASVYGVLGRGKMAPSVAHGSIWKCKSDLQLRWAAVRCILSSGLEIDNGNPG